MELSKSDTAGIKGIAILLMLWHHVFLNVPEYGALTHSLAIVAKVCVALFLFVSGYGLTKQYAGLEKRSVRTTIQFLLRRFVNFFLPFWFCFILVVVVGNLCGYSFHDAYPATRNMLKCVILDFFGQMGYDSYLGPWWFNKMIIQLYLVFPLLYLMLYNRYMTIVGLTAIVLVQFFAKRIPGNLFFIVEGGLPAFYLGMISSRFRVFPEIRKKSHGILLALVAVFIGIILSLLLLEVIKNPYQAVLIRALLALSIIVAYKSFNGNDSHLFEFVGKYATIMYLTHVLFLVLLPQFFYFSKCSILIYLFFTIVCLAAAMLIDWLERVTCYNKVRLSIVNHLLCLRSSPY